MAERASHAPPPATGGTHALTAADLDAMSPATWLALVRWYLETSGYRLDRAIEDQHAGTMSFACHQADGAADVAVTPLDGSLPASEHALLARRLAGERKHRQDGQLIVITRQSASHLRGAYAVLPQARLVDRAAILAHMTRQAEAFSNAQSQMDDEMDARATAARAVQATLRAALLAAAEALTRPAHRAAIPSAEGATTVAGTERDAQVLRQIMLACETLAEDWSSLFAATLTRNNALAIERDTASIAALAERVGHLGATLRQVVGEWSTPAAQTPRALQRWRAALAEEAALHCRLISAKLEAIDPAAWRDFEAARPSAASGAVAEAQAAWQRASLRARRLADESVAPAPQAPARAAPHP